MLSEFHYAGESTKRTDKPAGVSRRWPIASKCSNAASGEGHGIIQEICAEVADDVLSRLNPHFTTASRCEGMTQPPSLEKSRAPISDSGAHFFRKSSEKPCMRMRAAKKAWLTLTLPECISQLSSLGCLADSPTERQTSKTESSPSTNQVPKWRAEMRQAPLPTNFLRVLLNLYSKP